MINGPKLPEKVAKVTFTFVVVVVTVSDTLTKALSDVANRRSPSITIGVTELFAGTDNCDVDENVAEPFTVTVTPSGMTISPGKFLKKRKLKF